MITVERRRVELYRKQQERSVRMLGDDQQSNAIAYSAQDVQAQMSSINLHSNRAIVNDDVRNHARSMQPPNPQGVLSVARKRRVHSQVSNTAS